MSFDGAEIPAWGMFALAVVYIAFQFILKWQEKAQEKAAKRNGTAPTVIPTVIPTEIANQLASIAGALAGITHVLATLAQETSELYTIHLGVGALDDDNRPKWWADRESMKRIAAAMEEMNRRVSRLEQPRYGSSRESSRESTSGLPRIHAEKK